MLSMGSIFFSLIVAPLKHGFSMLKHSEVYSSKFVIFDILDTNILKTCIHLLLIV